VCEIQFCANPMLQEANFCYSHKTIVACFSPIRSWKLV